MRGKNPIRPPVNDDGQRLDVVSIFTTIQGEGPFAGYPAIFIRLSGCNLACDFCDTQFEDFNSMALPDIVVRITGLANTDHFYGGLVVITGGEPLRQNIVPLCELLLAQGFTVQIETNGTLWRPLPDRVHIVCSPKNTGQGYFPLREDLLPRLNAIKFIVSAHHSDYHAIAELGQTSYDIPIYIQPMDEHDPIKNAENMAHAASLAMRHGYRLSLQLHKILGIA